MEKQEMERQFRILFNKLDAATQKKVELDLHRTVIKKESEESRKTAFFEAVKNGNHGAVGNILSNGFDVNTIDDLGNTALIYAAVNEDAGLVKLLMAHDAKPSIKNKKGKSAMDATQN